jgi:hypothetical protein
MAKAVHFNGATVLTNHDLQRTPEAVGPHNCGVISYWYRTRTVKTGTILLSSFGGALVLRYQHRDFFGGGTYFHCWS